MKTLLLIAGTAAIAMGLLWIGQGLGFIEWPTSIFMIDQTPWALRGAALAVAGLAIILYARRR